MRPGPSRIIPARAGFTRSPSRTTTDGSDHPRSRGVYDHRRLDRGRQAGSSPLARGLPEGAVARPYPGGIIPARAGFTAASCASCKRSPDHPRSRGVYAPRSGPSEFKWGSSPLARGLPDALPAAIRYDGIIPARAGFTWRSSWRLTSPTDHPRSRGVYQAVNVNVDCSEGSSPLARGLRGCAIGSLTVLGIIPARAGFTETAKPRTASARDHPRSRGVYPAASVAAARVMGSSPLARGLQGDQSSVRENIGIIPARAGFTHVHRRPGRERPDHPRSRGVYEANEWPVAAVVGSSPLARGLLADRTASTVSLGIIPARAGFTVTC